MRRVLVLVLTVIVVGSLSAPSYAKGPDLRARAFQVGTLCAGPLQHLTIEANPVHGTSAPAFTSVPTVDGAVVPTPQGWTYLYGPDPADPSTAGYVPTYVTDRAQPLGHGVVATDLVVLPAREPSCGLAIVRSRHEVAAANGNIEVRIELGGSPHLDLEINHARRGTVYHFTTSVSTRRGGRHQFKLRGTASRNGWVGWRWNVRDLKDFTRVALQRGQDYVVIEAVEGSFTMPVASPAVPHPPAPSPATPTPTETASPTPTPTPTPTAKPCPLPPLCL